LNKDYYKILELQPSATLQEIKTAYRRLALQYHPDKHDNDLYASARFEIIKEAYEILTDPKKKEYYLQQRWYDRSINRKQTDVVSSPVSILKQLLELEKYLARVDIHRMDTNGLIDYLHHIMSTDAIEILNRFEETEINHTIIKTSLKCLSPVPYTKSLPVLEMLARINSRGTEEQIESFRRDAKKIHTWNKLQPWIIALIVLVVCIIIFLVSQ
jgi:curved DNA-binding protein CbpA